MAHAFEWKEEYSVQVKELDEQHKKLVQLIFRLFTAMNEQKTREELKTILDRLISYAVEHFSTEEKYFQSFQYEQADEHIAEHRKFTNKVADLKSRLENNEIEISFELIDFLEDWLVTHLMEQDRKYIECFTSNGLK